jgi:hypothetical protein
MIDLERMKGKQKKSIEVWDILKFNSFFPLETMKEFSGKQNAGSITKLEQFSQTAV